MTAALLGAHAGTDVVAFGGAGDRTASQLLADAAALALTLPEATPGSHVAVIAGDRYAFAAAALAVWRAGHAVALPPNGQPDTVSELIARPEVVDLLHDRDAPEGRDVRPLLGTLPAARLEPITLAGDRLVATVFTSGSTGTSQACPKTAGQLLDEAETLLAAFPALAAARVVATVPAHHIYGLLFGVLVPLVGGGAFLRDVPLHAETIAARTQDHEATILVSVPAHLRSLELVAPGAFAGLRLAFSSAAPLPARAATMLRETHTLTVVEVLGSSETGGIAWRDRGDGELWTPLPSVTVAADEEGRLLVDSPFLPPDAPRPMATADLVALVDGGARLSHLGRADGVVKVGGKRVALAEVEARLTGLDGVTDAAVVAVPTGRGRGTELLAAVVAPGWSGPGLRRALGRWLEPAAVPRRFRLVTALPREDSGKITRRRLLALFAAEAPARPRTVEILQRRTAHDPDGGVAREVTCELRVPLELVWFDGHFPTLPVLPGVVQLHDLVLDEARRARPGVGSPRRLSRLKFRSPVAPGEALTLALRFKDAADGSVKVAFTLDAPDRPCSQGTMVFSGPPA